MKPKSSRNPQLDARTGLGYGIVKTAKPYKANVYFPYMYDVHEDLEYEEDLDGNIILKRST